MREKFSIKTISDDCLEKLRMTPGQRYQQACDPPNYFILSNPIYTSQFQYVTQIFTKKNEKQTGISDQITKALYGAFIAEQQQNNAIQ